MPMGGDVDDAASATRPSSSPASGYGSTLHTHTIPASQLDSSGRIATVGVELLIGDGTGAEAEIESE